MTYVAGLRPPRKRLEDTDFRSLDPAEKVRILTEMGFTPVGSDHEADCAYVFDEGYICNCVPPATMWAQPKDVLAFRGETWEDRKEAAKRPRPIYDVERY